MKPSRVEKEAKNQLSERGEGGGEFPKSFDQQERGGEKEVKIPESEVRATGRV